MLRTFSSIPVSRICKVKGMALGTPHTNPRPWGKAGRVRRRAQVSTCTPESTPDCIVGTAPEATLPLCHMRTAALQQGSLSVLLCLVPTSTV